MSMAVWRTWSNGSTLLEPLSQRLAFDVLHDQKVDAVLSPDVMEGAAP